MKRARHPLCWSGYLTVSKTDKRINPIPPHSENTMEIMAKVLSVLPLFLASWPLCLSHLSDINERLKNTDVTEQPAIKRGFNLWAPTSEMYAIV